MSVLPSRLFRWVFDFYLDFLIQRHFKKVQIEMPPSVSQLLSDQMPILLVSNHCSWWDGFFLARLQRQIAPHGSLFTVMLKSELGKHPWLKHLGAIGLDPRNPVSVARAFHKIKILSQEQAGAVVIAYFPQGEIRPQFESHIKFKPGIELLVRMLRPVQIVPVALGIEPLNEFKPYGFIAVGQPLIVGFDAEVSAQSLEASVMSLLRTERAELLHRHLTASARP